MTAGTLYAPPAPPVPRNPLSAPAFLRAIRTNALTSWPEAAYHQPVFTRRLFGRPSLLLSDPEAIHRVLVDNHANYHRSPASIRILRPITGSGLLLSEGDDWRLQRRTIAPALAPRIMPLLARHIMEAAHETVATLHASARRPVDLLSIMEFTTLEIAGRSMFSLEMRSYGATLRAMLQEYAQRFSQPRLLDLLLPPSIPTLRDIRRGRFQRRWMALMDRIMQARLAAPPSEDARDLFDLLRAARDPETGRGFSPPQLRDQLATLLLAGHATTAVSLFWALTLLSHDPAEQQRVADEVVNIEIGADTLPQLVRTRAVVSEAMRLYPPAFAIARVSREADQAGPTTIPARTLLIIAPWVLHRHHTLWRNPAAFDPDRFMPEAPPPPRFAYLPFGTGPRICVGAQFAMTEAILVLALFIRHFLVEMEPGETVLPVGIVTTQPDHPPLFRLTPR